MVYLSAADLPRFSWKIGQLMGFCLSSEDVWVWNNGIKKKIGGGKGNWLIQVHIEHDSQ